MSKLEVITRHNIIIKTLRKHSLTYKEIENAMASEFDIYGYDLKMSKRTFKRDRDDIFSLYRIDIQFDNSSQVYYIKFQDEEQSNIRQLEAFDTFNAMAITDRIANYIQFEKRKPLGTEHLFVFLHAIQNQFISTITYQKFGNEEASLRNVEPYVLKEFKNRWYLLAKDCGDNVLKTFALDRISYIEIQNKKFRFPKNFTAQKLYQDSFGITSPSVGEPQEVVLSFNPTQGQYIKSLPLHRSQQILIDSKEELRIKLKLFITHDFFMELLSFGEELKILAPETLVQQMRTTVDKVQAMYAEK